MKLLLINYGLENIFSFSYKNYIKILLISDISSIYFNIS